MANEAYEMINRLAESAIRLLVTVNGGAAIAVMAFAQGLISTSSPMIAPASLATSLAMFAVGTFCAVFALGMMLLFLGFDGDPEMREWRHARAVRNKFRVAAWIFAAFSLFAFAAGSLLAAASLLSFQGLPA